MTDATNRDLRRWPRWLRRAPALDLYGYSFVTILAGTLGFVVVSHFPE